MALSRRSLWCALAVCLAIWLRIDSAEPLAMPCQPAFSRLLSLHMQRSAGESRRPSAVNGSRFNPGFIQGHSPGLQANRGAS